MPMRNRKTGALHKRLKNIILILVLFLLTTVDVPTEAFTDVSETDWFYETVTEMAERGTLTGYPDGSFHPDAAITAGEFVSVAARLRGLSGGEAQVDHWAGSLMRGALDAGWYDWDEIPPSAGTYDAPISRQLAVKVAIRAFAPEARGDYLTESAKIVDFSQLNGRYYEPVLAAYAIGLVKGDPDGCFRPLSFLSRAEACTLLFRARGGASPPSETLGSVSPTEPIAAIRGGVSENGALQVIGTQLCNAKQEPIVLRGMSSHGLHWFPEFYSRVILQSTVEQGANLFRAAMYTDEGGYLSDPERAQRLLFQAVDNALALDMYAIIDWHILRDGNPGDHLEEAKTFFAQAAERYQNSPGVIYEICNEPNGNISWSENVKPYAEAVIPVIRAIDPDAVVLVGSPTWSQDLHKVAEDPLDFENILYTCHFYAGTHTGWLRDRISQAMAQGLPVFISEWGTSAADGNGGVFAEETQTWLNFMNQNRLSWANWSLCDKNESSAAIIPGSDLSDGIRPEMLTESGRLVFSHFTD